MAQEKVVSRSSEVTRPGLPAQAGIGLKPEHFRDVLATRPPVGFFEVHAENYMVDGGPYHHYLGKIREQYALSLHGVGLSLGGEGALDTAHLRRLKDLIVRYQPASFSEHLAWSTHSEMFFNDLLPVVYDKATLLRVCRHIDEAQEILGVRMLLENPSTYVEFARSTMTETTFLREIVRRTGCGLLLDVTNVHVSCTNHGRDPLDYVNELPLDAVGEVHLAGFAIDADALNAPLLIDSHGCAVDEAVWGLYAAFANRLGPIATLLERDNDVPSLAVLVEEAMRAEKLMTGRTASGVDVRREQAINYQTATYSQPMQHSFAGALLDPDLHPSLSLRTWNGSDPAKRLAVYRNNVVGSLIEALADTFPVVEQLVGTEFFRAMAAQFVRNHPPTSCILANYGDRFPEFVENFAPASGLPYLPDVARLEFDRVVAYHAFDADCVSGQELARVLTEPEQLPAMKLRLHPSVHVVESRFAVVSLWEAHQTDGEPQCVDISLGESALVLRHETDVLVVPAPLGTTSFVSAVKAGAVLGDAAATAAATHADFDLSAAFSMLLSLAAISSFESMEIGS